MVLKHLNKVFNNTQNSYKYYWWLSIIEICFKEEKKEISYEEIVFKLISKLWYPVNYFKLSFGKIDQCSKLIKQIQKNYHLEDNLSEQDLFDFLIKHKNSNLMIKITKELTRYVPYRFIRSWYSTQTKGIIDSQVNSKVLELQNDSAPYNINLYSNAVIINSEWLSWIKNNYTLLKAYTLFELIKYLEKENPNVVNLTKKLEKPKFRNLSSATKYWGNFITEAPNQIDVFQNIPLNDIKGLSIDHFLPWSFLTHDLIWNLHPINKSVNSAKSNYIPNQNYFKQFYNLQYGFCNFLLKKNLNKPLEDYYKLFNCSNEELNSLSQEQFIVKMDNFYLPQCEIAKNMGFVTEWSLS
ncbi:HNH endonuclease domain-containing protein [Winogradskyella sp. PC D3.3]